MPEEAKEYYWDYEENCWRECDDDEEYEWEYIDSEEEDKLGGNNGASAAAESSPNLNLIEQGKLAAGAEDALKASSRAGTTDGVVSIGSVNQSNLQPEASKYICI